MVTQGYWLHPSMAKRLALPLVSLGLCLIFVHGVHGRLLSGDENLELEDIQLNHTRRGVGILGKEDSRTNYSYFESRPPIDDATTHAARWQLYLINAPYFGSRATFSVWGVAPVQDDQISLAAMWIVSGIGGPPGQINAIQVGWHVYPKLYGDTKPHFFIFWTADGYQKTGCYNLACPGFVYTTRKVFPGELLQPVSSSNGTQVCMTLSITKENTSGDWYLRIGEEENAEVVGYWPRTLFTTMADHGSQFAWGGGTVTPPEQPSPPMGSGEYASKEEGRAASVKNIQLYDGSFFDPVVSSFQPGPNNNMCYGITPIINRYPGDPDGDIFYYGGPGGCKT